jgi:hypothetical protein
MQIREGNVAIICERKLNSYLMKFYIFLKFENKLTSKSSYERGD